MPAAMWAYTFRGDDPERTGLVELARGDAVAGAVGAAACGAAEQPLANSATVATASSGVAGQAHRLAPPVPARRLLTAARQRRPARGKPSSDGQTGNLLPVGRQTRLIVWAAGAGRGEYCSARAYRAAGVPPPGRRGRHGGGVGGMREQPTRHHVTTRQPFRIGRRRTVTDGTPAR